jgi:hypothetical protein
VLPSMSVKRNVTVPDGRSALADEPVIILKAASDSTSRAEASVQTLSNLLLRSPTWLNFIVFTPTAGSPFSTGTVLERTMSQRAQPPHTDSRSRARGFFVACPGELRRDPPWPCPYTHRVRIHLKRLWFDIRDATERYKIALGEDIELQTRFESCMRELYPVSDSRPGVDT